MTTREKTSALGATFLFVLAFRPGYSEPASPANAPDHREHTASATYDGTPSSHPPFIEALNAGVDAYTPAEPNRIPLPYAATPAPQHYVETFRRVWRRQNRITFASGFYTRPNTRAIAFFCKSFMYEAWSMSILDAIVLFYCLVAGVVVLVFLGSLSK